MEYRDSREVVVSESDRCWGLHFCPLHYKKQIERERDTRGSAFFLD